MSQPTHQVLNGVKVTRSLSAILDCGKVHANDMVYLADGSIGKVIMFWQQGDGEPVVHIEQHMALRDTDFLFDRSSTEAFLNVSCVVEAVFWRTTESHILAIVPI